MKNILYGIGYDVGFVVGCVGTLITLIINFLMFPFGHRL